MGLFQFSFSPAPYPQLEILKKCVRCNIFWLCAIQPILHFLILSCAFPTSAVAISDITDPIRSRCKKRVAGESEDRSAMTAGADPVLDPDPCVVPDPIGRIGGATASRGEVGASDSGLSAAPAGGGASSVDVVEVGRVPARSVDDPGEWELDSRSTSPCFRLWRGRPASSLRPFR